MPKLILIYEGLTMITDMLADLRKNSSRDQWKNFQYCRT